MTSKPPHYTKILLETVTIITGGSSGIGAACVRHFYQNGGKVVFCSNAIDEGEQLVEEIRNSPKTSENSSAEVIFIPCDVTVSEQIVHTVQQTVTKFGQIDYLINNVGWHPPQKTIDDFEESEFRSIFELNVMSCFLFSKHCLPHIRKRKGSIVNISSMACIGQEKSVTYIATKAALNGITKALAVDEAKHGVRVNSVLPTSTDSPLFRWYIANDAQKEGVSEAEMTAKYTSFQILNRLGTGEDIATACLFLLAGTSFITGLELPVSGGCEIGFGPKA